MPPQFVVDITHFKVSRDVWKHSKSRKVIAFIEGCYKNAVIKSNDSTVHVGSQYCIPYTDSLTKIRVHFFFIDGLLTVDIGTAEYSLESDSLFQPDGSLIDVNLSILPKGSNVPVGRVLAKVSAQYLFEDEPANSKRGHKPLEPGLDVQLALPEFRFKRLSRAINWQRLRGLDIERTVQNNDVQKLLTCLDDVTVGDVSLEDVDPHLHKALQLAQYGSQYILSCRKVMKDRQKVINTALEAFQDEEDLLDLKIAKLRARERALQRESSDLDTMSMEYAATLRDLNPKALIALGKSAKESLRPPSVAADQLDGDGDYSSSSGGDSGGGNSAVHKRDKKKKRRQKSRVDPGADAAGRLHVPPRGSGQQQPLQKNMESGSRQQQQQQQQQKQEKQQQPWAQQKKKEAKGWHSAAPGGTGHGKLQPLYHDEEDPTAADSIIKQSSFVESFEQPTDDDNDDDDALHQQQPTSHTKVLVVKPASVAQPNSQAHSDKENHQHFDYDDDGNDDDDVRMENRLHGKDSIGSSSKQPAAEHFLPPVVDERGEEDRAVQKIRKVSTRSVAVRTATPPGAMATFGLNNDGSMLRSADPHASVRASTGTGVMSVDSLGTGAAGATEATEAAAAAAEPLSPSRPSDPPPSALATSPLPAHRSGSAGTGASSGDGAGASAAGTYRRAVSDSDVVDRYVDDDDDDRQDEEAGGGGGGGYGKGDFAHRPSHHTFPVASVSRSSIGGRSSTDGRERLVSDDIILDESDDTAIDLATAGKPDIRTAPGAAMSSLVGGGQQTGTTGAAAKSDGAVLLMEDLSASLNNFDPTAGSAGTSAGFSAADAKASSSYDRVADGKAATTGAPSSGSGSDMQLHRAGSKGSGSGYGAFANAKLTPTSTVGAMGSKDDFKRSQIPPSHRNQQQGFAAAAAGKHDPPATRQRPVVDEDDPYETSHSSINYELSTVDSSNALSALSASAAAQGGPTAGGMPVDPLLYESTDVDTSKSMVIDFVSPHSEAQPGGEGSVSNNPKLHQPSTVSTASGFNQYNDGHYMSRDDELDESNPFEDPRERAAISRRSSEMRLHRSSSATATTATVHADGADAKDATSSGVDGLPASADSTDTYDEHSPGFGAFGSTVRKNTEDDDVLFGTSKFSGGRTMGTLLEDTTSTAAGDDYGGSDGGGGAGSTNNFGSTGNIEPDSLGGTNEISDTARQAVAAAAADQLPPSSTFSPVPKQQHRAESNRQSTGSSDVSGTSSVDGTGSNAGARGGYRDDDATPEPPSYDSILRDAPRKGFDSSLNSSGNPEPQPVPSLTEPTAAASKSAKSSNKNENTLSTEEGEQIADMYYYDEFEEDDDEEEEAEEEGKREAREGADGGRIGQDEQQRQAQQQQPQQVHVGGVKLQPLSTAGEKAGDAAAAVSGSSSGLQWVNSRASMEEIELARALDIYISAVGVDEEAASEMTAGSKIQLRIEFMGIASELSNAVAVPGDGTMHPIGFAAHLPFTTEEQLGLLKEEIAEYDDAIAFQLYVIDAGTGEPIGTANVELWVMIEDSVNILRQEMELLTIDMSDVVGTALVDVKGFRLLKKCAAMQRLRRKGIGF